MSISHEEAIEFVRDKLGIGDVRNDKLDVCLLNDIVRALLSEVPFQNIFLYNTPPEKRFPSEEDVIRFGMTRQGGVCIHNNWFAAILLKALGFNLYTIAGTYAATNNSNESHLMSVVRGLKDPEDPDCSETLFLVDVGNGYPTPGAVPLHKVPHDFPLTAGLEIRYDKIGDRFYRMHRTGDLVRDPDALQFGDGWIGKFSFTLDPKEPKSVETALKYTLCTDPPSHFMSQMKIFRWPKNQERVVALRGNQLLFFGSENNSDRGEEKQKQSTFIDFEKLEENIVKYFPTINLEQLKEAMPAVVRKIKVTSERK